MPHPTDVLSHAPSLPAHATVHGPAPHRIVEPMHVEFPSQVTSHACSVGQRIVEPRHASRPAHWTVQGNPSGHRTSRWLHTNSPTQSMTHMSPMQRSHSGGHPMTDGTGPVPHAMQALVS
jgi:hypothetical protein